MAERNYLTSKSGAATKRSYPTSKVKSRGCALLESSEVIPHVQGKRNPSKMVGAERGHQRADRVKSHAQKTSQSGTRTTALSNSVKLSHAMWGYPRWMCHGGEVWQNVVHWRREWQTVSVFLPWEPQEQYDKQKDRTLKDELPRSVGAQYATRDQWRNYSRNNKGKAKTTQSCGWDWW